MKDRNGKEIKEGDKVHCNGLEFIIEEFKSTLDTDLACGHYGCINTDLLELIEDGEK